MKDIYDLLGRIFIAFIFAFEAYDSWVYQTLTKQSMIDYHLTWQPDLLLWGSIWFLILGSLLVLLGYRSSFGAFLLLLYWLPLTFVLYQWWKHFDEPLLLRELSRQFMKNIAICGGLLLIMVNGSGKYSVRRLLSTTKVNF